MHRHGCLCNAGCFYGQNLALYKTFFVDIAFDFQLVYAIFRPYQNQIRSGKSTSSLYFAPRDLQQNFRFRGAKDMSDRAAVWVTHKSIASCHAVNLCLDHVFITIDLMHKLRYISFYIIPEKRR